jgi:hypothetical protein
VCLSHSLSVRASLELHSSWVEAFWTPLRPISRKSYIVFFGYGCDTAVRVTCFVALAYAYGAIDDRADKGNLMYQSELISFQRAEQGGRGRTLP